MMRSRQGTTLRLIAVATLIAGAGATLSAQQQASSADTPPPIHGSAASTTTRSNSAAAAARVGAASSTKPAPMISDDAALRVEGEKRFRTNCGRCHMAPHKFAPRTMATVVRHMRVRAMITDEDMRLILRYLTQ